MGEWPIILRSLDIEHGTKRHLPEMALTVARMPVTQAIRRVSSLASLCPASSSEKAVSVSFCSPGMNADLPRQLTLLHAA